MFSQIKLSGEYDILIATDVFEHVPDPIGLTAETAEHLCIGGQYLIANCFAPVILSHLPQLFYFNVSWDAVMQAMGWYQKRKFFTAGLIAAKVGSMRRRHAQKWSAAVRYILLFHGCHAEKLELVNFLCKHFVVETSLESHSPKSLRYQRRRGPRGISNPS